MSMIGSDECALSVGATLNVARVGKKCSSGTRVSYKEKEEDPFNRDLMQATKNGALNMMSKVYGNNALIDSDEHIVVIYM